MKRIASLLLVIIMLAVSIPFNVSAATNYTQTIDDYNGTRYENYLVIYNRNGSKTGTNPYGYEVVVTNGVVTAVGGNDNLVPEGSNSFVASGHGTKSDWLANYVMLGMKASIDTASKKVTFTKDNSTLITALGLYRDQALAAKDKATEACIVYDASADTKLTSAENTYNQYLNNYNNNGTAPSQSNYNQLAALYTSIASLYTENSVTEYRGAWVRPTQTSYAEVEAYVKKAYDAGLNMLSVETLYSCTTIYPTPSGSLLEHNPKFGNFDVLDAYITACHKYDMELHVWMPVFYSGSNGDANWKRSVAYKKSKWRLTSQRNSPLDQNETYGLVFLNPANSEVQDFLLETYEYILTNYDIDGFQLDYIRYRDRTANDDYGYDSGTIEAFKEAYPKYANYSITYNTDAAYWNDWVRFRASHVTKMVERVRALVDRVAPEVMLTADVGPSSNEAYSSLYQDYKTWLANNWLDMIHPMAYGTDYSPFMVDFQKWANDSCLVVPGLGTYMEEFDADDMVKQTRDMLNVGCDGVVYFELSAFFSKGCGSKLTSSLFTEKAIAPHLDINETMNANLDRLSERVSKAATAGSISTSLKNRIMALVTEAKTATRPTEAIDELEELLALIEEIDSEALYNRIREDLIRAAQTCARELRDYRDVYKAFEDKIISFSDTEFYVLLGEGEAVPTVEELTSYLTNGVIKKGSTVIENDKGVGTEYVLTNGFANFKFIVKGDVNGDGKISSMDYVLLKRQVMKSIELNDIQKIAANINKPHVEKLDTLDYTLIKRHVVGTFNIYG